MIFTLKDVGPIKEAKIDLSHDLTIFTGPNNTGKTSVNYRIVELLNRASFKIPVEFDKVSLSEIIAKDDSFTLDLENHKDVLADIFSEYRFFDNISTDVKLHRIEELLSFSFDYIIRHLKKQEFNIRYQLENKYYSLSKKEDSFLLIISKKLDEITIEESKITFESFINKVLFPYFIFKRSRARFFPAERIATATFGPDIAADEFAGKPRSDYPWAIRYHISDVVRRSEVETYYTHIGQNIEKSLLGGKFDWLSNGSTIFRPNHFKGGDYLQIPYTGSMVKSLVSIVEYFRYQARHGDFIIIDEPEMNLHPDNQIKIARLIVEWVNAGFKVLISTHSNYILRELNNMILLSEKPKSKQSVALRKKYGYGKEHLINKDNVGVHFFNDGKVAQIPVTENGFDIPTIEETVFDLNERSEEIFFKHDR